MFIFRCAKKVVEGGFRYFGLQFYGECWSGDHAEHLFATESKKCIGHNYGSCDDNTLGACTGEAGNNYVYEIVREGNYHCMYFTRFNFAMKVLPIKPSQIMPYLSSNGKFLKKKTLKTL